MNKMKKEEAEKYLKRKGIEVTNEKVKEVMQEGKIYGDPVVEVDFT